MPSFAIRRDSPLLKGMSEPIKKTTSGSDTRTMTAKAFGARLGLDVGRDHPDVARATGLLLAAQSTLNGPPLAG
jgi:hypothetical protein